MRVMLRSKSIESVEYDGETASLLVTFLSGKKYIYAFVPEKVFSEMLVAESAGRYFARHIRNQYKCTQVKEG
jgi:hypothetical protein